MKNALKIAWKGAACAARSLPRDTLRLLGKLLFHLFPDPFRRGYLIRARMRPNSVSAPLQDELLFACTSSVRRDSTNPSTPRFAPQYAD
jgi:hypothetical protein